MFGSGAADAIEQTKQATIASADDTFRRTIRFSLHLFWFQVLVCYEQRDFQYVRTLSLKETLRVIMRCAFSLHPNTTHSFE